MQIKGVKNIKVYLKTRKGYLRFAKTSVEVVADKNRATWVEPKDVKDVKDTIYSMKPCIGIITTEVAK